MLAAPPHTPAVPQMRRNVLETRSLKSGLVLVVEDNDTAGLAGSRNTAAFAGCVYDGARVVRRFYTGSSAMVDKIAHGIDFDYAQRKA